MIGFWVFTLWAVKMVWQQGVHVHLGISQKKLEFVFHYLCEPTIQSFKYVLIFIIALVFPCFPHMFKFSMK